MPLVVTGIRASAEADGSHALELSDGSTALIPRGQVQYVAKVLQHSTALHAFAQSQRPDVPAESPLAPKEFRSDEARSATSGRETNPDGSLGEYGWAAMLCEDEVLRNMKTAIDKVLTDRASGKN